MLLDWWKWFRFTSPSQNLLPNQGKNGIMIMQNNIPICCGFMYATSSPILFHIEWIVSNPNVKDRLLRKEALNALINSLLENIKSLGGTVVYTSLKNESLLKRYEDCGFKKGSTNAIEMVRVIEH